MDEMLFGELADGPRPGYVTCYDIERSLAAAGLSRVAGVDEVGRGAWAGPVTVCAVVVLDGAHDYIGRGWPVRCEVKADRRSVSVAAASVIAKVHRDRYMAELSFGESAAFAFAQNAGYPSPAHQDALKSFGPTPYHRLSWSYLDDLPEWRHLKRPRPGIEGQLTLL